MPYDEGVMAQNQISSALWDLDFLGKFPHGVDPCSSLSCNSLPIRAVCSNHAERSAQCH